VPLGTLLTHPGRATGALTLTVALLLAASSPAATAAHATAGAPAPTGPVYGDTLTDVATWGDHEAAVAGSREALDLGRRLTHRIVFDPGTGPADYAPAIRALSPYSDIMGEIVDSSSTRDYPRARYVARTRRFVERFGNRIDIYEIGNEVNGEWAGRGAAAKARAAFRVVEAAGHPTALTAYYNPHCFSRRSHAMLPWLREHVHAEMRAGLDYVLVSYYERDCHDHRVRRAEMDRVFGALHRLFPDARLGWGEIGLRRPVREQTRAVAKHLLTHYYGIKPSHAAVPADQYVTGGFWWFGQQDLYPTDKPLWATFRRAVLAY
jgi:hypothetical protein